MRITLPATMPLRVSTFTDWPFTMSFACVSAMRSSAISTSGRATRAMFVPATSCWPSSTGTCCSTPAMPAFTCSASAWRSRSASVDDSWSMRARSAASCAEMFCLNLATRSFSMSTRTFCWSAVSCVRR